MFCGNWVLYRHRKLHFFLTVKRIGYHVFVTQPQILSVVTLRIFREFKCLEYPTIVTHYSDFTSVSECFQFLYADLSDKCLCSVQFKEDWLYVISVVSIYISSSWTDISIKLLYLRISHIYLCNCFSYKLSNKYPINPIREFRGLKRYLKVETELFKSTI